MREFLELASRLTKQSGALLVLDEIQCGLGRTGRHFAYQHYGVLPDVVTVAKPLACGLPLGAILTTERVASCMHPGMHGTTFGGGPLACAVAIEFLRAEKKLLKHVRTLGEYFHAALEALDRKHKSIQDVRGAGLMQAVELDSPELAKAVAKQLLQEGIIINRTHETVLRFLPPYVIQKKHVDQLVKALDAALRKNAESRRQTKRRPPRRGARQSMRTREAVLPDAEQIHALISAYSGDGTLLPRTLAEICENVRDFIVLEDDGRIIGCGALHLYGVHLAEIRSITVDPSSQSNGGGRRLVKALLAQAEKHRVTLRLPVHSHSRILLTSGIHHRQSSGSSRQDS